MTGRHEPKSEARIRAEASAWVVKMHDDMLGAAEEMELAIWRGADPRHEAAFVSMNAAWNAMDMITPPPAAARRAAPRFGGRAWAITGLAAAASLLIALALPQMWRPPAESAATQIAELAPLRLPDGTVVTLGADSHVSWRFTDRAREVTLERGEAFFEVADDANRPFSVVAGSARIRDIGTAFNVNINEARVSIAVREGIVEVQGRTIVGDLGAGRPQMVRAGESVDVRAAPILPISASLTPVVQISAAPDGWREGRLVYDGATLGDLVADANRYYPAGIVLQDADAAALPVTASFRPDEVGSILEALSQALPIEVEEGSVGQIIVRRRPSGP